MLAFSGSRHMSRPMASMISGMGEVSTIPEIRPPMPWISSGSDDDDGPRPFADDDRGVEHAPSTRPCP